MPTSVFLLRRRAGAALAAAGLVSLAGAAPVDPPALAAPGAATPSRVNAADVPGLAAPTSLADAYERALEPIPDETSLWRPLTASVETPADPAVDRSAEENETPRERRGWLSFSPIRVQPAANYGVLGRTDDAYRIDPTPDAISTPRFAYAPQDLADPGPAPAPMPIPEGLSDDGDYRDLGASEGGDAYRPVPQANRDMPAPPPPHRSVTLPPDTVIRNGVPVRDLRTPAPPVSHHGPPPTALPYGGSFGPSYGGVGAGFGAGPITDLATAGGMCDSGLCDGVVPVYRKVRIEDPDHVHPCAVRQVIAVADPCGPKPPCGLAKLFHRDCTGCAHGCHECAPLCDAAPALVFVEVCVPPCRPEEVKVTREGHRVHLDYGKYEVTLTTRDGYVKVDYDD